MTEILQQMRDVFAAFMESTQRMTAATLEYSAVFAPRLTDLTLIPKLYDWYCAYAEENKFTADLNSRKKQFVFVVLMLFSPPSIFGGKIRKALRNAIAHTFGISDGTAIYKMRDKAVAWQSTYKTFADEIDKAYQHIDALLSDNGFIEA